eukprot:755343-Hanusia_phi.AAC.1
MPVPELLLVLLLQGLPLTPPQAWDSSLTTICASNFTPCVLTSCCTCSCSMVHPSSICSLDALCLQRSTC